ncbi:hypothetical protein Q4Q39_03245 [Flavivirga amylovorans]|uniref:GNAT family N-acetyltransferase n=1 Tax=Flavivirga amylovorans TaxID=870486 RepID=A0ABT8WXR1_9FLAO|nr:hypothetical protein [Flavivirga amylovorans]MDO5986412.1 hypothetical protein [Flavivirga amylovorans]
MKHIVVRRATIQDVTSLTLLARVTFREAFGTFFKDNQTLIDYFDTSFSIKVMTAKLNDKNNVFLLHFLMIFLLDMQNC